MELALGPEGLVEVVSAIGREIPRGQVDTLASAIAKYKSPTAVGRHAVRKVVNVAKFTAAVERLWGAWKLEPDVSGVALALALRSAASAADALRASQSMDVTWTGPSTNHVPVRMSGQVLKEIIDKSVSDLFIVSFAAYKVDGVLNSLRSAAQRGVSVRLLLETEEDSSGALKKDAADAFKELKGLVSFWVWPKARRPQGGASMHAKAAIADRRTALVTSANLTGHALERNIELGVLIQGGAIPGRLSDHFAALIAGGELVEVKG